MYCEHCCIIFPDGLRCPQCGGRYIRELREDDLCLAAETNYLMSSVLADVLRQEGVPFLTRNALGAALATQVGAGLDRVRFLVRPHMLEKAKAIADDLLSPELPDDETDDAEN